MSERYSADWRRKCSEGRRGKPSKRWTTEDIETLRKLYSIAYLPDIASQLGRSQYAVKMRAGRLGLKASRQIHWNHNWLFVRDNPYSKSLSATELPYIAGIIDGEGSISVNQRDCWVISVVNTYEGLIRWLEQKVAYSNVNSYKGKDGRKDYWIWTLYGNLKIKALLELLCPYLIVKRERAEIVLLLLREEASARYEV